MGLDIPKDSDCLLVLWATAPKLVEALRVMEAWGFEYKTHGVWDKEIIGMGYWFRGMHEDLLFGTRGKVSPPDESLRIPSMIREKRSGHSAKPEIIYSYIESWFPDQKYIELFARKSRAGWISWGNEING